MKSAISILALLGLLMLAGCGSDSAGPSTSDYQSKRAKLMAKVKEKGLGSASKQTAAKPKDSVKASPQIAGSNVGWVYDPTDKRDPFRSYVLEQKKQNASTARGPLEQYDLSQLRLTGIVWDTNQARALIRVPSGRGYIVGTGTAIGKNDGRITVIDDNTVLVKERYVDFLGEETTKDIKLKIRR